MNISDLSEIEILQGTFSLIFVLVSSVIGILFLIKYFSNKKIEFITIGLTWILLSSGWWGSAFSFLSILLFATPLNLFQYLFISNVFLPFVIVTWLYSFCHIFYPKWEIRGLILTLFVIIPLEIVLILLLFTNPQSIGKFEGVFNYSSSVFLIVFEMLLIVAMLITGVFFSYKSIQEEDPKIKWRGKVLLIAFILLAVSGIADSLVIGNPFLLVLMRLLLISSAILYYLAFFFNK